MTTRFRIALYAGGIHVWCPPENDPGWILAEARDRRPDWLVFETSRLPQDADTYFETLKKSVLPSERLEGVAEIVGPGPKSPRAVIFRYQAPP